MVDTAVVFPNQHPFHGLSAEILIPGIGEEHLLYLENQWRMAGCLGVAS
jgi:hypothetical protein